jgi:hypothetical protein
MKTGEFRGPSPAKMFGKGTFDFLNQPNARNSNLSAWLDKPCKVVQVEIVRPTSRRNQYRRRRRRTSVAKGSDRASEWIGNTAFSLRAVKPLSVDRKYPGETSGGVQTDVASPGYFR